MGIFFSELFFHFRKLSLSLSKFLAAPLIGRSAYSVSLLFFVRRSSVLLLCIEMDEYRGLLACRSFARLLQLLVATSVAFVLGKAVVSARAL